MTGTSVDGTRGNRAALPFVVQWRRAIRDDASLKSSEKLVAYTLAERMDKDGACRPSMATVAREAGLSERTVRRAVVALSDDHYLSVSNGQSYRYQAALPEQAPLFAVPVVRPRQKAATVAGVEPSDSGHQRQRLRTLWPLKK